MLQHISIIIGDRLVTLATDDWAAHYGADEETDLETAMEDAAKDTHAILLGRDPHTFPTPKNIYPYIDLDYLQSRGAVLHTKDIEWIVSLSESDLQTHLQAINQPHYTYFCESLRKDMLDTP